MKKLSVLSILLALLTLAAFAQDGPTLYNTVSGSVVYLQHEIFITAADSTKPELWKRLENLLDRKILDAAWPLASGSGFILDNDGSILTNRHVAKMVGLSVMRRRLQFSVGESLDQKYGSNFSDGERTAMKADFEKMISKGKYAFSAMQGTRSLGEVTVLAVADDEEPDLALVRVAGNAFQGYRLAEGTTVGERLVGSEVLSFGYPLGSELDEIFKQRTVTMNRGTISSFRDTELSIQHSAAISHGSSGGPLLGTDGMVIGVNTAGLQEQQGNSLFYAIDVGKVREFLAKGGFGNVLRWNGRQSDLAKAGSRIKLNALGEIEGSADVLLDIDRDVEVSLDGIQVGVGPLMLHLVNPVSVLDLRGPKGSFSARLRLLSSISGSTTLKPPLAASMVPVVFTSAPEGASVIANGRELGKTPLKVDLAADTYAIQLRQDGQWYRDTSIDVAAGTSSEHSFEGVPAFPLACKGLDAAGSALLRFDSGLGTVTWRPGEPVTLPSGEWSLKIEGSDAFLDSPILFNMPQGPHSLDLAASRKTGPLRIRGMDVSSGAVVWVDGIKQPPVSGGTIQLPLGIHTVYAWEDGFQPLEETRITVRGDNKSFITWDRLKGHDVISRTLLWTGAGVGGLGAVLLGVGLFAGQNDFAVNQTSTYNEYVTFKSRADIAVIAGAVALGSAGLMEILALIERAKYQKQRKRMIQLEKKL